MPYSDAIKRHREARGMTQEQLALAAGFNGQSRIGNYERGDLPQDGQGRRHLCTGPAGKRPDLGRAIRGAATAAAADPSRRQRATLRAGPRKAMRRLRADQAVTR